MAHVPEYLTSGSSPPALLTALVACLAVAAPVTLICWSLAPRSRLHARLRPAPRAQHDSILRFPSDRQRQRGAR